MKTIKLILLFTVINSAISLAVTRDLYQLKIYHLKNQEQETQLDDYLKNAFIPALHKAKIQSIGVFKPINTDKPTAERLIYVFIPFHSFDTYIQLDKTLAKDEIYQQAGASYLNAPHNNPPYIRIETILLRAFEKSPSMNIPRLNGNRKDRVYELRSYEGPTEKLYKNKVEMFNKGDEIGLFKRLDFNAVFYAEVLAGGKMPNLMYLTTFENKQSREDHWNAFNNDSYWKELSANPYYQHNVSHSDILFLYPTAYSDF